MRGLAGSTIAAVLLGLVLGVPGRAGGAEHWVPDGDYPCSKADATMDIVACSDRRRAVWDTRLNQAYKVLQSMLAQDPDEKAHGDQLTKAQRLWVQFRDANCGYYALEQGTIRQIKTAECLRRMTQDRAIELQGEGPQ